MSRYTSIFSYYGGKSKVARLYPKPVHDCIVEPFAGGAAYALRYQERSVWINEKDPKTFAMWRFLLSDGAADMVENCVPDSAKQGDRVSDMVSADVDPGLVEILRGAANHGTQGRDGVVDRVTPFGAKGWHRTKPRLIYWIPKIRHWKLTGLDYLDVDLAGRATWFIDPPYDNSAGRLYRVHDVDYARLAQWVRSRRGQVIVCENGGASWLPFKHLVESQGANALRQKVRSTEVIYHRSET